VYTHAIAAHFRFKNKELPMATSVIDHLWRQSLFANRVCGMNPSEADKGNQDEKKDRAIVIKLDLFQMTWKSQRETKKSTKNLTCHRRCLPRFELSGQDVPFTGE
jgi:hypothetical protein